MKREEQEKRTVAISLLRSSLYAFFKKLGVQHLIPKYRKLSDNELLKELESSILFEARAYLKSTKKVLDRKQLYKTFNAPEIRYPTMAFFLGLLINKTPSTLSDLVLSTHFGNSVMSLYNILDTSISYCKKDFKEAREKFNLNTMIDTVTGIASALVSIHAFNNQTTPPVNNCSHVNDTNFYATTTTTTTPTETNKIFTPTNAALYMILFIKTMSVIHQEFKNTEQYKNIQSELSCWERFSRDLSSLANICSFGLLGSNYIQIKGGIKTKKNILLKDIDEILAGEKDVEFRITRDKNVENSTGIDLILNDPFQEEEKKDNSESLSSIEEEKDNSTSDEDSYKNIKQELSYNSSINVPNAQISLKSKEEVSLNNYTCHRFN